MGKLYDKTVQPKMKSIGDSLQDPTDERGRAKGHLVVHGGAGFRIHRHFRVHGGLLPLQTPPPTDPFCIRPGRPNPFHPVHQGAVDQQERHPLHAGTFPLLRNRRSMVWCHDSQL